MKLNSKITYSYTKTEDFGDGPNPVFHISSEGGHISYHRCGPGNVFHISADEIKMLYEFVTKIEGLTK